jgi:hypothetical protein
MKVERNIKIFLEKIAADIRLISEESRFALPGGALLRENERNKTEKIKGGEKNAEK